MQRLFPYPVAITQLEQHAHPHHRHRHRHQPRRCGAQPSEHSDASLQSATSCFALCRRVFFPKGASLETSQLSYRLLFGSAWPSGRLLASNWEIPARALTCVIRCSESTSVWRSTYPAHVSNIVRQAWACEGGTGMRDSLYHQYHIFM